MKNKKRILIALQDFKIKDFIEKSFNYHYQLLFAESSREALKQITESKMNLIIVEEELPEMGGLNLLKILKIAYPECPVIIISRIPSYRKCLQAFRHGCRDYFSISDELELIIKRVAMIIKNIHENNHLGNNFFLSEIKSNLSLEEKKIIEELSSHNKNNGVYRVIKYLHKNFSEDVSRDELAQIACYSPFHFSRVFKKHTGYSYIEYLTILRINKAKELLKEKELTISEVCYAVGYYDLSHFGKTFRKIIGCSPISYRNRNND